MDTVFYTILTYVMSTIIDQKIIEFQLLVFELMSFFAKVLKNKNFPMEAYIVNR